MKALRAIKKFRKTAAKLAINSRITALILFLVSLLAALLLYDNPSIYSGMLLAFSLFMLTQNYFENKIYAAAANLKVSDAMIPKSLLLSFDHSTSTQKALEVVGKSYQPLFPVFFKEAFLGVVERERFISTVGGSSSQSYISDFINKKYKFIYAEEELQKILRSHNLKGLKSVVVLNKEGSFVGLLAYDRLVEYLLIDKIFKESKNRELEDEFWL